MTSLTEHIEAAATAALAGTGTYLRESAEQATLDTSGLPAPFIVCGDYTTSQAGPESRTESAFLTLYFADTRTGQGDSPEAHQAAVARMEVLKRRFLTALDASPRAMLTGIKATPFEGAYAAELDGVGVQLTLAVPAVALC